MHTQLYHSHKNNTECLIYCLPVMFATVDFYGCPIQTESWLCVCWTGTSGVTHVCW